MNEKTEQLFKILGVAPLQSFYLNSIKREFCITKNLTILQRENDTDDWEISSYTLKDILLTFNGAIVIKWSTEEKIIINYLRLCDYKWMARDENGCLFGYKDKPHKDQKDKVWDVAITSESIELDAKTYNFFHYITWEDNEPYFIG